jgi:hypothetical protein
MKRIAAVLTALILPSQAGLAAAEGKGARFWNLTSSTVAKLYLSPAGKNEWGADLCASDPDGAVDHDERLKLPGVTPGEYDLKLADKRGKVCLVRNVKIEADKVFSVQDKDLTDCK